MAKQINSKIPKIRFKGYERDWEEEPILTRIANIIDFRGRTPKKLGLDWSPSGYLALSALNVKDGYIDRNADAHYGDEELYTKWMKGNELRCNQVLFTTEAPMGNVAQIPDNQKYILSQRTIAFVTNTTRLSEDYLAILLKSPNVFAALLARSSGGTAKGISQRSLSSLLVHVCDELTEQTKIGKHFRELDRLIGLHQRKHDKLEKLKKSMLQKMFPKPGATVPEIRFKGYSGDWVEKRLADIIDLGSGRDYKHLSPGDIPVYGTGGFMLSVNEALSSSMDAIGIGRKGTIDKPYILKAPFWTVDTLFYAIPKPENCLYFVYCIFQRIDWKQKDESTGIPSLSKITINQANMLSTSPKEQQKIGAYFRTLDELISKHGTQIQKLKQIKSASLEKMFV